MAKQPFQHSFYNFEPETDRFSLLNVPTSKVIEDARSPVKFVEKVLGKESLLLARIESGLGVLTAKIGLELAHDALQDVLNQSNTLTSEALKQVFKNSNRSIYAYAEKMGSSGKMGVELSMFLFDGERVHVGRNSGAECILFRAGESVSLFKRDTPVDLKSQLLGLNAQVLVDFASIKVAEGDVFLFGKVSSQAAASFKAKLEEGGRSLQALVKAVALEEARISLVPNSAERYKFEENIGVWAIKVGEPIISLTRVLSS